MFKTTLNLLRPFILFAMILVLTLFISRMGLAIWKIDRFDSFTSMLTLVLHGFRIDLSVLGYLLLIPAILHPWGRRTKDHKTGLKILKGIFFFIYIITFINIILI